MRSKWTVAISLTLMLALVTQARHMPEPLKSNLCECKLGADNQQKALPASDVDSPAGNYPFGIFVTGFE